MPKIPKNVVPIIEVLGEDTTIRFLLEYGGSDVVFSEAPRPGSMLFKDFGEEIAQKLAELHRAGKISPRIPAAKYWISTCLRARGWSRRDIIKTLKINQATYSRWQNAETRQKKPQKTPGLFDLI